MGDDNGRTLPERRSGPGATWHALPVAQVLTALASDAEQRLSAAEARVRQAHSGPNQLRAAHVRPAWAIFLAQFRNLPTVLLLVATGVSLSLSRGLEAAAISAVIVLAALLVFVSEHRALHAMAALGRLGAPLAPPTLHTYCRITRPRPERINGEG